MLGYEDGTCAGGAGLHSLSETLSRRLSVVHDTILPAWSRFFENNATHWPTRGGDVIAEGIVPHSTWSEL